MKRKLAVAFLGLLYVLFPWDFIPDIIVGLGWLDDSVMLLLLWQVCQYLGKTRQGRNAGKEEPFGGDGTTGWKKPAPETKDPREVLGLSPGADTAEIKAAYRNLAAKYHPDKVEHLGEEFRNLAERRFKDIQAAYQELMAGRA
jgi:DnaJ like chaperone protein